MANKKLIEDLQTIECSCGDLWIQEVASRALKEIEYLQSQLDYKIECRASDAAWANFKPGDIKWKNFSKKNT